MKSQGTQDLNNSHPSYPEEHRENLITDEIMRQAVKSLSKMPQHTLYFSFVFGLYILSQGLDRLNEFTSINLSPSQIAIFSEAMNKAHAAYLVPVSHSENGNSPVTEAIHTKLGESYSEKVNHIDSAFIENIFQKLVNGSIKVLARIIQSFQRTRAQDSETSEDIATIQSYLSSEDSEKRLQKLITIFQEAIGFMSTDKDVSELMHSHRENFRLSKYKLDENGNFPKRQAAQSTLSSIQSTLREHLRVSLRGSHIIIPDSFLRNIKFK